MGFHVSYPIKWIQFLLVGVEELLSYTVLYHMKKNEVSEVIKCFRIHFTLFPMVTVAISNYGGEFSEKLTQFCHISIFYTTLWCRVKLKSRSSRGNNKNHQIDN